jgi:hypothetical protein
MRVVACQPHPGGAALDYSRAHFINCRLRCCGGSPCGATKAEREPAVHARRVDRYDNDPDAPRGQPAPPGVAHLTRALRGRERLTVAEDESVESPAQRPRVIETCRRPMVASMPGSVCFPHVGGVRPVASRPLEHRRPTPAARKTPGDGALDCCRSRVRRGFGISCAIEATKIRTAATALIRKRECAVSAEVHRLNAKELARRWLQSCRRLGGRRRNQERCRQRRDQSES